MKIKHINEDYVILKPLGMQMTQAGLYLVEKDEKKKPEVGQVVAMGKNNEKIKGLKVGDRVVYLKWGGSESVIGDEHIIGVKFEDIVFVYE